jgi:hypothetical protein
MSSQVNSHVTKVEVTNGTPQSAKITIRLWGFEKGEYVQLSGFAAQRGGGFAAICAQHEVEAVDNNGIAVFDLTVTPSKDFVPGTEVTTSLWAAKVWLSLLDGTGWVWNSVYSAPEYDH